MTDLLPFGIGKEKKGKIPQKWWVFPSFWRRREANSPHWNKLRSWLETLTERHNNPPNSCFTNSPSSVPIRDGCVPFGLAPLLPGGGGGCAGVECVLRGVLQRDCAEPERPFVVHRRPLRAYASQGTVRLLQGEREGLANRLPRERKGEFRMENPKARREERWSQVSGRARRVR